MLMFFGIETFQTDLGLYQCNLMNHSLTRITIICLNNWSLDIVLMFLASVALDNLSRNLSS